MKQPELLLMVSENNNYVTDHVIFISWICIVPESVIDLNFTLTNKTLKIMWNVS